MYDKIYNAFVVIPPVNEVQGVYRNNTVCLSVCLCRFVSGP